MTLTIEDVRNEPQSIVFSLKHLFWSLLAIGEFPKNAPLVALRYSNSRPTTLMQGEKLAARSTVVFAVLLSASYKIFPYYLPRV